MTNQTTYAGGTFTYTVPEVTDPDGDTLTYQAFQGTSNPLPTRWIKFASNTRIFTFTPRNAHIGELKIRVSVSDGSLESYADFKLTVTAEPPNRAPTAPTLKDQTATEDKPFSYTAPAFTDPDEDTLTYTAAQSNNDSLPSWLSFNAITRTLSGTPAEADTPDTLTIRITASDGTLSSSATFTLTVEEVNDAPIASTGPLPASLGNLTNLEFLYLGDNPFDGGSLPDWVGNLTNLKELGLYRNGWTGAPPSSLGNLINLEVLSLGGNPFDGGSLPAWIGNLTSLRRLYLYENGWTGPLPASLGNLTNLERLFLGGNPFDGGQLPAWMSNLTSLEELDLSDNGWTGRPPWWLGRLTNLEELDLSDNGLAGPLPYWGGLTRLRELDLGSNALTGPLPWWLEHLAGLTELSVDRNALTGPVPGGFGNLSRLRSLFLDYNPLITPLPHRLTDLTELDHLSFTGTASVCAPSDDAFQTWLGSLLSWNGEICGGADDTECRTDSNGYDSCAAATFRRLASSTGGTSFQARTASDVPAAILAAIDRAVLTGGSSFDLMFIIDDTGSMSDDISAVKANVADIIDRIRSSAARTVRVGLALYGDRCVDPDGWLRWHDLTTDLGLIREKILEISVSGGGDWPESVYDAVDWVVRNASWSHSARYGILIGDAPPHESGDSCYMTTFEQAVSATRSTGVQVNLFPILSATR